MSMVTIYDLLEVDENASKEEIEKAYRKLIVEYRTDPKFSGEDNNNNEIILNKLKLSYEILTDDEKRKRYDEDLAKKRAEELIKNVSNVPTQEEPIQTNNQIQENVSSNNVPNNVKPNYAEEEEYYEEAEEIEEPENTNNVELTDEERKKLKKAAQKEFKDNLKKAQKAEEEYNRAYNEAYNDYLRKMGYSVKEPWTFKRVRNLIISLLVIFGICALIWILPPTKNLLIKIYEENFIVKSLVDIVAIIFNAIINAFK